MAVRNIFHFMAHAEEGYHNFMKRKMIGRYKQEEAGVTTAFRKHWNGDTQKPKDYC
jgi:hypothetical protein